MELFIKIPHTGIKPRCIALFSKTYLKIYNQHGGRMMHIGFIVGIIISMALIIVGIIVMSLAKIKGTKNKWAVWLIAFGVVALISAVINFNLFNA